MRFVYLLAILIEKMNGLFNIGGKICERRKFSVWTSWEFGCKLFCMAEMHKNIFDIEQKSVKKNWIKLSTRGSILNCIKIDKTVFLWCNNLLSTVLWPLGYTCTMT